MLLDRFVDSSLAYQGAGRALGVEEVRAVNLFAAGGLLPDRTLLLRIDPAAGRARQRERAREPDRLEREDDAVLRAGSPPPTSSWPRAEPRRIRVLDAAQPPAELLHSALAALEDLLAGAPASH